MFLDMPIWQIGWSFATQGELQKQTYCDRTCNVFYIPVSDLCQHFWNGAKKYPQF